MTIYNTFIIYLVKKYNDADITKYATVYELEIKKMLIRRERVEKSWVMI